MDREEIIRKVNKLIQLHRQGYLGGEKMPEDENPCLDKASKENYMYFNIANVAELSKELLCFMGMCKQNVFR